MYRLLSTEKNSLDMAIKQLAKLDQDIPDLVREKKNLEPVVDGHLDALRRLETQIETLREEETEVRTCIYLLVHECEYENKKRRPTKAAPRVAFIRRRG